MNVHTFEGNHFDLAVFGSLCVKEAFAVYRENFFFFFFKKEFCILPSGHMTSKQRRAEARGIHLQKKQKALWFPVLLHSQWNSTLKGKSVILSPKVLKKDQLFNENKCSYLLSEKKHGIKHVHKFRLH